MKLEEKLDILANAIELQAMAIQALVDTSELILHALAQAAEVDEEYKESNQYLDG